MSSYDHRPALVGGEKDDDDHLSRPVDTAHRHPARNNMNCSSSNSNSSSSVRFPLNLRLVTLLLVFASWIVPARLDEHDHEYKNNEEVILWMNTVGPYHNRQETYSYFSLPFCKGSKQTIGHYHETLGEALQVFKL